MGFFDLLKRFTPHSNNNNDELNDQTEGIFNRQNLILDGNDGNLYAKPNIPKISISPTSSEKYAKSNNFLKGQRTIIQNPLNPNEVINGQNGSQTASDPSQTVPNGQDDTQPASDGQMPFKENMYGQNSNRPNQDGQDWSNYNPVQGMMGGLMAQTGNAEQKTASKSITDEVNLPDAPVDEAVPTTAKKTSKWRDILVGALQNISKTDLSKVDPSQRKAAFLGSLAGGAVEGASTGRYAGKVGLANEQREVRGRNAQARADYEVKLKQAGEAAQVKNNQLAPYFKQQTADLNDVKAQNTKLNQEAVASIRKQQLDRQINKDEGDFRVKMLNYAQKDTQFKEKMKAFKSFKTIANADGSFGLIGVRPDGSTDQIKMKDGSLVNVPDPNIWAKTLADIQTTQSEAAADIPAEKPEDRRAYVDNYVQEQLKTKYPDINQSNPSRKQQKIIDGLKSDAASDYDKTAESRRSQQVNRAKATGARKVLNKPSGGGRKPYSGITNSLNGVDFSTQFKNRQNK